jgi:integrase
MPLKKTRYPGIYERTQQTSQVVYLARVRVKGAGAESKSFGRLTAARKWHLKRTSEMEEREALGRVRATLAEAIKRYLAEELGRLAPSEQRNRKLQLAWWKQAGDDGKLLLRNLTRSWAREKILKLREKGRRNRPVSYSTGNRYFAALSAVLSACEEWEWITRNPLHSSGRRKKAKGEREKPREREEVPEEMKRMRKACGKSLDSRLLSLMECALASGARQGELMRLRWQDVELKPLDYDATSRKKRAGVPRAKTLGKNGDDRILYFPGDAARILPKLARNRFRSAFVFADPEDPEREPVFPAAAWRYAKEKTAKVADLRFHDLRHFWACRLLDHGATIAQLMVLGGWRSVVSMRVYIARAQRQGSAPVAAMHARSLKTAGA